MSPATPRRRPEPTKERIAALAVPPAWTDVWICRRRDGHIQATGRDDAGRKQYVYHPEWIRLQSEAKFDRNGSVRRSVAPAATWSSPTTCRTAG